MEKVSIEKIIPYEKNTFYFDDIIGDNWTEFINSVKTSGIIEPIVITQDKVIVSGHQRVRACKELGMEEIACEIKLYDDTEELSKDDLMLKDILETNLRQRGIGNTNAIKFARCITALEKIYGIKHGGDHSEGSSGDNRHLIKSQNDLANQLGTSRRHLTEYKKLLELAPELQNLIEDGKMPASIGYKVLSKLSKDDQEKVIRDYGKDYMAKLTQKRAEDIVKAVNEKADKEIRKTREEKIEALSKLSEIIKEKQNDISLLNLQVESINQKNNNLKSKLSELSSNSNSDELKSTIVALKSEETKYKDAITSLQDNVNNLQIEIKNVKTEKENLLTEFTNLGKSQIHNKNKFRIKEELLSLIKSIDGCVGKIEMIMGDVDTLQDKTISIYLDDAVRKSSLAIKKLDSFNKMKGVADVENIS